jgi:hypothetical protein
MKYDINQAVAAYASSMGNSEKRLKAWCEKNGTLGYLDEIMGITKGIEDAIFDKIVKNQKSLTGTEIEALVHETCTGIGLSLGVEAEKALLDNAAWMAWHEGYLK